MKNKSAVENQDSGVQMIANRLLKNLRLIGKWAKQQDHHCYWLYDANIPRYAFAIDCVDLSNPYLDRAIRNFILNNLHRLPHKLIQKSCIEYLRSSNDQFDLVFLDPRLFQTQNPRTMCWIFKGTMSNSLTLRSDYSAHPCY